MTRKLPTPAPLDGVKPPPPPAPPRPASPAQEATPPRHTLDQVRIVEGMSTAPHCPDCGHLELSHRFMPSLGFHVCNACVGMPDICHRAPAVPAREASSAPGESGWMRHDVGALRNRVVELEATVAALTADRTRLQEQLHQQNQG